MEFKLNKRIFLFLFFVLPSFYYSYIYSQNNISEIEGIVVSCKERDFNSEIILKVEKLKINDKSYTWRGKIIVETKRRIKVLNNRRIKIKNPVIKEIPKPKNPFEFDYENFLKRNGIFFKVKAENIEFLETKKNIFLFFSYLRRWIENRIEKYMKSNWDGYELVKLITIGSDNMPHFIKEIGVRTGIYHLFVISGIHIVFLIIFLKIIFIPFQRINNTNPKFFPFILFVFIWSYTFLCGFKIPVMRAVLMVSFYILFELFNRYIEPLNSLILTAILFIIFNPFNIYSTSFLLSFLATAGILIIHKRFNLTQKRNFLINNFLATISAQIFILPIIFYNFGTFYPIGILTNLIFTQVVGIIMILSFISILLPLFFPVLNFITSYFLKLLNFVANFSPHINVYFPIPFVVIYYSILILLLSKIKINKKFIIGGLIVFLLMPFVIKKSNEKEIIFFSSKKPLILVNCKNKGILISVDGIENPKHFSEIIYKFIKSKKIKIEKSFLINNKFSDNFLFASKFSKEIYLSEGTLSPYSHKKILKILQRDEKINFYDIEFIFEGKNLIIKNKDVKILILLNENIENLDADDRYFLIYLVKFKKNKKNEEKINNLKPAYLLLYQNIKKFENLKSLCQNYYLGKSAVVLNLKTKEIKYYKK